MTGLIYKEFKQNKLYIFLIIAAAAFAFYAPVLFTLIFEDKSVYEVLITLTKDSGSVHVISLVAGFLSAGILEGFTMKGDDKKIWSMFITSVPQGYRGFIRIKYEIILSMCFLMLVCSIFFDNALRSVIYGVTGCDLESVSNICILFFYIQIILRAAELPFIIRFGMKTGSYIKTILLLTVIVIISVMLVLNPGDVMMKISAFIVNQKNIGDVVRVMLYVFPFAAVIGYFLSYKISCKLYLKGAEHYDK